MAFSQRRTKGFRGAYEFDRKRVLVADADQISVFGFNEHNTSLLEMAANKTGKDDDPQSEVVPFHVVSYKINQPAPVDPEEMKDAAQEPPSDEIITFAGFVSDHDPNLILVMTYTQEKNITYLKILKIEKKELHRSYSFYQDEEKKVLIENLKNNLIAQGVHQTIQKYDSVKVTIEVEQKRLHVTKRGYRDTNIPVNPDEFVADEALTVKL